MQHDESSFMYLTDTVYNNDRDVKINYIVDILELFI